MHFDAKYHLFLCGAYANYMLLLTINIDRTRELIDLNIELVFLMIVNLHVYYVFSDNV